MRKIRSRPVYVETERGVVSLVFEASAPDTPAGTPSHPVGKPDVYIIDSDGVRKLKRAKPLVPALLFITAFALLARAMYEMFRKIGA